MALNPNKELKLYYSIGEVAEMLGVSETLLRYWEKEFPTITPKKFGTEHSAVLAGGHRTSTPDSPFGQGERHEAGGSPQGFAEQ